jgi:hypothetical protein
LVVSKLEGDAVVSYGLEDGFVGGQTFVESIEETYVAFRRAIELMVLNNSCRCNACANVSSLDLKFLVHYGSFAFQQLGDRDELLGTDVILIHRLLKSTGVEATGIHAYCLFTEAAVDALGIAGYGSLRRHSEDVADFGELTLWVEDMHQIYDASKSSVRVGLSEEEEVFEDAADFTLPAPVLWEYMAVPEYRSLLAGSDRQEITGDNDGRVGVGSTYHCFHGKSVLPQTILEWTPFEHIVTQDAMGGPFKKGTFVADYRLEPTETGTRLTRTSGRIEGSGVAAWVFERTPPPG